MQMRVLGGGLATATVIATVSTLFSVGGDAAKPGGEAASRLLPCPDTPSCVSRLSADGNRAMAAIAFDDTAEEATKRLVAIISARPRTRIVEDDGAYLHVEFRRVPSASWMTSSSMWMNLLAESSSDRRHAWRFGIWA